MKKELQLLKPEEFGIEEKRGVEISSKFTPIQIEVESYTDQYNEIIKSEITEDLTVKARSLRLKIRDLRTKNVNKIHKAEKDFYLAGGKFVDAWKNKINSSIELMEEKLDEIENYFVNIEKQRISELNLLRISMLQQFITPDTSVDYGSMNEDIFNSYFESVKKSHQEKLAAEKEAAEKAKEAERNTLTKGSDKEKLKIFFSKLKELEVPEFSSKEGKELGKTISDGLEIIKKGIIEKSKSLL